jgi:hypothetical protein
MKKIKNILLQCLVHPSYTTIAAVTTTIIFKPKLIKTITTIINTW